jgi:phosphate:Na+ symporter
MQISLILLHLGGAVMLLLWAVRMVRTGVERAYGGDLRRVMQRMTKGPIKAAGIGMGLAVLLQSSTAVAVLCTGLAASGLLSIATGIAVLLGADLGSALVVQILSFDLSWLVPVLLLVGGTMFLKFDARAVKQIGRILLGIALILLSLQMIGEATAPLRESTVLPAVIDYLSDDFASAFLLAILFTWLIHSSVAALLLIATFAAQGLLPVEVGISFVLGANFGGGIIAVWLSRGQAGPMRRIPMGALIFRGSLAILLLVLAQTVPVRLDFWGGSEAQQLVGLHVIFNAVLVCLCLPWTGAMDRLLARMYPSETESEGDLDQLARPVSALDPTLVGTPSLALTSATREVLRMAETIEVMLRPVMDLFEVSNREQVKRVRKLDEDVNRAHSAIKLYIAQVNRGTLSADEARRGIELTDAAINLEHVGDIIAKNLLNLVQEKRDRNLTFSSDGWNEMSDLHGRVLSNIQLALNVLLSGDLDCARQLVREKEVVRRLERDSHDRHLARLQSGMTRSIETSDIHLEVVRALKEINSLLATLAYPILTESGDLLESRLAQPA